MDMSVVIVILVVMMIFITMKQVCSSTFTLVATCRGHLLSQNLEVV